MIYSMLGKTNLVISRVGLGGIPLQRLTLQEATETVRYALDCGVNFIDTGSRLYRKRKIYRRRARGRQKKRRRACDQSASAGILRHA